MAVPFDTRKLPPELREVVSAAVESEYYGDALDAVEDHWHGGGERQPELLVAVAYMLLEDALTCMVDEVIPRGERGLALLTEARKAGRKGKAMDRLRARIRRAVNGEKKREAQTLALLETPADALDMDQVKKLAYALADRKGEQNAARAGDLFARVAAANPADRYYYYRAGLEWADGGQWDKAEPILLEATRRPLEPWLRSNDWIVDFAFTHRIRREWDDPTRLQALFDEAVAAAAELETYYPFPRPTQDALLRKAHELGLRDICRHVLDVMDQHRPARTMDREVMELQEQVRQWLEG